jgi:hypothetical protein
LPSTSAINAVVRNRPTHGPGDSSRQIEENAVMTDTSHPTTTTRSSPSYSMSTNNVSGWTGWVIFAGIMLIMVGAFQAIQGLVAMFNRGYYLVSSSGLVLNVDYTVWGWTHLILGILAAVIGLGLLAGSTAARVAGIVLAVISAILNLVFIAAYPIWSIIVITVDVIVIYAIVVHGRELKSVPM